MTNYHADLLYLASVMVFADTYRASEMRKAILITVITIFSIIIERTYYWIWISAVVKFFTILSKISFFSVDPIQSNNIPMLEQVSKEVALEVEDGITILEIKALAQELE